MALDVKPPINYAPFSYAHVCLIAGDQGSGKTNTAVAKVRDAYDNDCVKIYCKEKLNIECEVKTYDRKDRIAKIEHNGDIKLLRIPPSYKLESPMRIFANFHLYGIPYVYCTSFAQIAEWLEQDVIRDGWLVIDEYYIGGNARDSMTLLGKRLEKRSFQYRKMQLEVIIICPLERLGDWTMRLVVTERILCEYDEETREITLKIKKKGQKGTKDVTYPASQYWGNYWTNERIMA